MAYDTKDRRMTIWDALRERFKLGPISSHKTLMQNIRSKLHLEKGQRITKAFSANDRRLYATARSKKFWRASKYEDRHYFLQNPKEWKEGEVSILKGLRNQGLKGKELHAEFNKRVTPNRTYMAIHVKSSKLGLKVKKEGVI